MDELAKKIIIELTHYRILISNVFSWNRLRFSLCLHAESSHCVLLGRMEKWPTVFWNKGVGVFFNGHALLINTYSIPSLWPPPVQESWLWSMFGYSLNRLDNTVGGGNHKSPTLTWCSDSSSGLLGVPGDLLYIEMSTSLLTKWSPPFYWLFYHERFKQ